MNAAPPALASVHDVTPETLDRVERILERFERASVFPCALLVVPGKAWSDRDLERIHRWSGRGYTLAAHGWHHWGPPTSLRHRLHAALISRKEAEHLALERGEILALMQRSHDWFLTQGLPAPEVYVPPTWALGDVRREDLGTLPYRCIETLFGLWLVPGEASGRPFFKKLPVTGFLADTRLREVFSRLWNPVQVRMARGQRRPLRISVHPDDFELRIADQLEAVLAAGWQWMDYPDLWRRPGERAAG